MPLRKNDETVIFDDVVVVDRRPTEKRDKSVICRFADGTERVVPRSMVPAGFEFPGDPDGPHQDEPFELEVSAYLAGKWRDDPGPEPYRVGEVEVVRESTHAEYGDSIMFEMQDGSKKWVNLRGVDEKSEVRAEGDVGILWLKTWAAEKLGFVQGRQKTQGRQQERRGGGGGSTTRNVGQDARRPAGGGGGGGKRGGGEPPPDDDSGLGDW